jgi:glucose-1-phosphate thymidylyltransferase
MENINNGVILAAGEGIRMHPLTKYYSKIILPILDKPLLIYHLEIMQIIGIQKVFIVVSKNNYRIVQEFIERYHFNGGMISCELILQDFIGGTGHALLTFEKKLAGDRFLLLLGDEYYNDVDAFKKINSNNKDNLILGIVEYDDVDRVCAGCNVRIEDNYVSQLVEKPTKKQINGRWCWDGSAVLDLKIFQILHELQDLNPSKEKDSLCIVKAMQRLIEKNHPIAVLKKKCKNINITIDLDYLEASLIEIKKKYGRNKLADFLNNIGSDE